MSDDRPFSPAVRLALAKGGRYRKQARGIIKSHAIGAMSIGMLPVPLVDAIALTSIQWDLITRLADHYGVPMKGVSRAMVTSLIGGSLPVLFAGIGGSLLKLIPGFGLLAGSAALSTLAGAVTHATGKVFMDHFESGGTMDDYCPAAFKRQLRLELKHGRREVEHAQTGLRT